MKTTTTLAAIATLFTSTMFAQTGTEALSISINAASIPQVSMTLEFSGHGDDLFDGYDTTSLNMAANNTTVGSSTTVDSVPRPTNIIFPFTVSSDIVPIDYFDSRPSIDRTTAFPLGLTAMLADTITISASASFGYDSLNNSNNAAINFVYLEDLNTGLFYQILNNNVTLPIPSNTTFAMNYILHVVAKPIVTTTSVTCFASTNGTISMHNAFSSNWHYNIYDNANLILSGSVSNPDTTLYNFAAQTYTVAIYMDSLLVDSENVQVNSPVQVVAAFSTLAGNYVDQHEQIQFVNESTGADFFAWTFGDATVDSTSDPLHGYAVVGNYAVTLTARDSNGCTASFTDTMFVSSSQSRQQGPTIDHRTNNTVNDPSARTSNSNEVNIASGSLKITVIQNQEEQLMVQIMNMNGQLISSTSTNQTSTSFDVPANGVYVVTITSSNGTVVSKKIAITN